MGDDREEKPLTRLSAYCASTPISVSLFVIMALLTGDDIARLDRWAVVITAEFTLRPHVGLWVVPGRELTVDSARILERHDNAVRREQARRAA